jgi:hypothetical protein
MVNSDPSTLVGVFRDRAKADRAIEELKQAGFRDDQLSSTVYSFKTTQEAQESEPSRVVLTVKTDGRDQQAFSILFNNGANNADLPPGTVFEYGSIVSAQPETIALIPEPTVEAGFSNDSFFAEGEEPGHAGEPEIMDNPNFPHG